MNTTRARTFQALRSGLIPVPEYLIGEPLSIVEAKMKLFVCWCHLIENSRMTSSYLVLVKNKREARVMMRDGDHIVDKVQDFGEYVQEMSCWVNLTEKEEEAFLTNHIHCIEAGT